MSCSAHNSHDKKTESKDQKLSNQLEESPNLSDGTGLNNSITGSMRSKYFKDLLSESMDYSEDNIESSEITEIKSRISSSRQQILNLPENKLSELYAEQKGPQIYDVPSSNTSNNTIVNKLPEVFGVLPVFGKPNKNEPKDQYYENKILDFMNIKLNPDEFKSIIDYCSPEHLKTGEEVEVPTNTGLSNITSFNPDDFKTTITREPDSQLAINRHYKFNLENDMFYSKHLKYRRVRLLPLPNEEPTEESDCLVPGKDVICQVKVYRPYPYNSAKLQRIRHSVCVCDIMLHGDQPLTMLRDRIACTNDLDMRIDVSEKLDDQPKTTAKEVFPSGFLFINNIFYVDTRPGCKDLTAVIRKWAITKGIGEFPHKDMGSVLMRDLTVRMGHPEVYVHQGDCEHIFTVSDIRVVTNDDPLNKNVYPFNSIVSATQNAYCATCAEFCAKWVVTESSRIPFDPAYFCDTCLKLYMYLDGKKIGNFKVYSFKGNDVHLFKPI